MRYRYYLADVFTDRAFGGNPLAVLPEAAGLNDAQMQLIAREFNLSETTFLHPPESAEAPPRLRIFTPQRELPFAGHPTVGSAVILATLAAEQYGSVPAEIVFQEGVGPIEVAIESSDGRATRATLTTKGEIETRPCDCAIEDLAAMLSLEPADILEEPIGVSAGVPFLCIFLHDRDGLARSSLDLGLWRRHLAESWAASPYLIAPGETSDYRVRMFAPLMGLVEDPATGGAAAALAGLLGARAEQADGSLAWSLEQGVEMGRPSRLDIEAVKQGGALAALRVGGGAVIVGDGWIEAP